MVSWDKDESGQRERCGGPESAGLTNGWTGARVTSLVRLIECRRRRLRSVNRPLDEGI